MYLILHKLSTIMSFKLKINRKTQFSGIKIECINQNVDSTLNLMFETIANEVSNTPSTTNDECPKRTTPKMRSTSTSSSKHVHHGLESKLV